jgi:hypothetical protein
VDDAVLVAACIGPTDDLRGGSTVATPRLTIVSGWVDVTRRVAARTRATSSFMPNGLVT